MNTPNKLTILRMILVPFFLVTLTVSFPHNYLVALIIFSAASLTDYFDGKMAREKNLITNFGKFLDPLADKMLTTAALLGFVVIGDEYIYGALWVAFITLFREFIVSGIRLSAVADGGKVIAANIWGKAKTVSQMVAIIFIIFVQWLRVSLHLSGLPLSLMQTAGTMMLWLSAVLTVISGTIYVVQNAKYIDYRK